MQCCTSNPAASLQLSCLSAAWSLHVASAPLILLLNWCMQTVSTVWARESERETEWTTAAAARYSRCLQAADASGFRHGPVLVSSNDSPAVEHADTRILTLVAVITVWLTMTACVDMWCYANRTEYIIGMAVNAFHPENCIRNKRGYVISGW